MRHLLPAVACCALFLAPSSGVADDGSLLLSIPICPPKYEVPLFVPVEELRAQLPAAAAGNPDWIVRDRPLPDCIHCLGTEAERQFRNVDLPLKRREYESQIRLAQAEIRSLERRLADYRYFNKGGALLATVEETQLALVAAEERLRHLRYEQLLWRRHHELERQLRLAVPVLPAHRHPRHVPERYEN